jgi:hypothetical protein
MRPSRLEKVVKYRFAAAAEGQVVDGMRDTEVYDFGNAIGIVGFLDFD